MALLPVTYFCVNTHFSSAKIRKIVDSAKDFCVFTQKSFAEWLLLDKMIMVMYGKWRRFLLRPLFQKPVYGRVNVDALAAYLDVPCR